MARYTYDCFEYTLIVFDLLLVGYYKHVVNCYFHTPKVS